MAAEDANDLRRALEKNEIIPYFQPLVELRTGLLSGFEVLARWQHPVRGLITPNEFIPLAEDTGLNGQLTGNLLRAVFAAAKNIPDHLTLSVNISLTQLTDFSLPKHIHAAAEQASFPLNRLILEITESALASNTEHAYRIATELKEQGSRLALDDFGTGYSSLRHLQSLPFDELKIDASFVRSMGHTRESRKIAAAIVGLGNSLSLTTVAEGVESQTIADMLLWLGCDLGQGWLYGRPVPPEQLPEVLAARLDPAPPIPEPRSPAADSTLPLRLEALPTQRLAQLNAIYDGVPVGLCFIDRNLRYVSVNKRLAGMHHLPVAAHLGRYISEVMPTVFPLCEPYLLRALNGEASNDLEICYPDPNPLNEKRTHLISFHPARDEADEVIGVSVSVVDITRRKQAEQALAESEDHYRHTVELNPQVPWTADPDGMILDASQRWESLTGLSVSDSLGTGWIRALHPDDVKPTSRIWTESLRTGRPLDVQYRIHRVDGTWRWMRARATARRGKNGKIIRWYGTVEDINDQRSAEEALRRSEARLKAVFDAVPVGIVIAEAPDGRVVMSNPRAEEILRSTEAAPAMIDDYCKESISFTPGPNSESNRNIDQDHDHPLAKAIMGGKSIGPTEYLRFHSDGSSAWISLTGAPVLDPDGKVSGGVVAIQDIDEDKREMQRLSDLNTVLKIKLETH
ncbi:EAL domain-containing protein [Tunturiibacter gelidoferens]|uniref:PAS domain S-box-containing protein n=1 Tax=Tunturiibacter lichenicola TaxID=2051959 RepID=A0A7Y9NPF9_9BACT|nr:EAL domain-containing protein [Edaphobacter lichenicola]NYF53134.1 PAS domain S-box-containing protein [Edaphobacter lichenicola]